MAVCVYSLLTVGTIHVLFGEMKQPALQVLQTCIFCNTVNDIRGKIATGHNIDANTIPIIVAGDFNVEPYFFSHQIMGNIPLSESNMEVLKYLTYAVDATKPIEKVLCYSFIQVVNYKRYGQDCNILIHVKINALCVH